MAGGRISMPNTGKRELWSNHILQGKLMSHVLQVLHELSAREIGHEYLVPAMQYKGKTYAGKRGEDHAEIGRKHNIPLGSYENGKLTLHSGFMNIKTKEFHSRADLGGLEATDIMTPMQRFHEHKGGRKYNPIEG
jgi:hypothetical protein